MRLIDADDLKAKIMIDAPDFMDGGSSITKAFIMAMLSSRAATPTIDAVPVVRCKDCVFYACGGCGNIEQTSPARNLLNDISPDWYCADGERKEE